MKRCPECNRVETDEALKFCRVDGATLVNDSSPIGEAGTAQPGAQWDASEVHTSVLPHHTHANVDRPTGPTTSLPQAPAGATREFSKAGSNKGLLLAIAVVIVIAVAIGGFFIAKKFSAARTTSGIESVAVLPFENTGGNADSEYLSDGLAESLIYRLSQIGRAHV